MSTAAPYRESMVHISHHSMPHYIHETDIVHLSRRWLALRLELCGNGIVTGAALTGVVSRRMGWLSKERATLVGLSLTLALAVTNSLGWMVRMSTEAESQMNSVERVAGKGSSLRV